MWIGFDFDGTLVKFPDGTTKSYGPDNTEIVTIMQSLYDAKREVRVFTARASHPTGYKVVREWLEAHGMPDVKITDRKDFEMMGVFDDLTIPVDRETGAILTSIELANKILAFAKLGLQRAD